VNRHLPELAGDLLVHGLILNPLDLGLEVGTHLETPLQPALTVLPDAAALVTAETGIPGVAVFIGRLEG
jgi:hypothetical protein